MDDSRKLLFVDTVVFFFFFYADVDMVIVFIVAGDYAVYKANRKCYCHAIES